MGGTAEAAATTAALELLEQRVELCNNALIGCTHQRIEFHFGKQIAEAGVSQIALCLRQLLLGIEHIEAAANASRQRTRV